MTRDPFPGPVLIVGATARAAAASARRRGWLPWTIDLFADRDTQLLAVQALRCPWELYPQTLPDLARGLPPMPWCYTGGLENHPEVVDALSRDRPLIGNPAAVLRQVRDPFRLAEAVRKAGGCMPITLPADAMPAATDTTGTWPADARPDPAQSWLIKRLDSTAGLGVRRYHGSDPPRQGEYWQQQIDGEPVSAAFETTNGQTSMLGVSRQLCGEAWLHAPDFQYCGNVRLVQTPWSGELHRIATQLASDFNLSGRWGIDAIFQPEGLMILEINPRESASMELYDFPASHGVIGKGIYYAPRDLLMPEDGPWEAELPRCLDLDRLPAFADLSSPGTLLRTGEPVLTFFAIAASCPECLVMMKDTAMKLDQLFGAG